MESKSTILEKAGVYINASRVSKLLNECGVNNKFMPELREVENKLLALRKKGVEKPVFGVDAPKKPLETDSQEVKERYALVRKEFDTKKQEFEQKLAEYDRFTSPEYTRANARFRLIKKLQKLVSLLEMTTPTTEARTKQVNSLREKLKGGLTRPTFSESERLKKNGEKMKQISGHEIYIRFTEVAGVEAFPEAVQDLKNIMGRLAMEDEATNELFTRSAKVSGERLRFSKDVYAVVAMLIQQSTADVLKFAIKDAKKNKKKTLSIENLRSEVINESNFSHLFFRSPAYDTLNEYIRRKTEYEQKKRDVESKNKGLKGALKSFVDMEKSSGFMKVINGSKYWVGLNINPENRVEQFSPENIARIFDMVKSETKNVHIRLSNRAKEYMCNLITQLLERFVRTFEILRSNRKEVNNERSEEKSIRFDSVIGVIRILLSASTSSENVKKAIENMTTLSSRLRELKKK